MTKPGLDNALSSSWFRRVAFVRDTADVEFAVVMLKLYLWEVFKIHYLIRDTLIIYNLLTFLLTFLFTCLLAYLLTYLLTYSHCTC